MYPRFFSGRYSTSESSEDSHDEPDDNGTYRKWLSCFKNYGDTLPFVDLSPDTTNQDSTGHVSTRKTVEMFKNNCIFQPVVTELPPV